MIIRIPITLLLNVCFLAALDGACVLSSNPFPEDWRNTILQCSEADLQGFDLHGDNISFLPINNAGRPAADLIGANLRLANLSQASLNGASLDNADLQLANLTSTSLWGTSLVNADLSGADLTSATVWATDFRGANLTDAIGLESTRWNLDFEFFPIAPRYDHNTLFDGTGFSPDAAGWVRVPEPSYTTLILLGLILACRRRRSKAR